MKTTNDIDGITPERDGAEIPPEENPKEKRGMYIGIAVAVLCAAAIVGGGFYAHEKMKNTPAVGENTGVNVPVSVHGTTTQSGDQSTTTTYTNAAYGIVFTYPESLYLKESFAGTSTDAWLELALVEDTPDNRDAVNGNTETPRELPPGITIEAWKNTGSLSPADAARLESTWNVATGSTTPAEIAGEEGIEFPWSGLYEGRTAVVTHGGYAYAFSVSWLAPDDAIVDDFASLVKTVSFENPAE